MYKVKKQFTDPYDPVRRFKGGAICREYYPGGIYPRKGFSPDPVFLESLLELDIIEPLYPMKDNTNKEGGDGNGRKNKNFTWFRKLFCGR